MPIDIFRVDDRLIHGQVVVGWTRAKGIDTILAIDDEIVNDNMQKQLMKLAVPPGVNAFFYDVDTAARKINAGALRNRKTMVLVKGPKELLRLLNLGVEISEVNLGNLRNSENKIQLLSHVSASKEEIEIWKEISNKGVKLIAQTLPDKQAVDFGDTLKKY